MVLDKSRGAEDAKYLGERWFITFHGFSIDDYQYAVIDRIMNVAGLVVETDVRICEHDPREVDIYIYIEPKTYLDWNQVWNWAKLYRWHWVNGYMEVKEQYSDSEGYEPLDFNRARLFFDRG